jgi:hypothetical protein
MSPRPSLAHRLAAVLNWGVVAALAYVGVDYLRAHTVMPHHQIMLGVPFAELSVGERTLLLTLLKGTGMVAVVGAVSLGILLVVPFRRQERWVRTALLVIGGTILIPTLVGTFQVRAETGAPAPWWPHVVMLSALLAAWWLTRDFGQPLASSDVPA